jgi:hypothetical protein
MAIVLAGDVPGKAIGQAAMSRISTGSVHFSPKTLIGIASGPEMPKTVSSGDV